MTDTPARGEALFENPAWSATAPLVSILVPARNEALNIEPCVGSLLAQDYPNCEWIEIGRAHV